MAKEKEVAVTPPRENALLFGHEAAEKRFLDEFSRGLTHHAYLMTGSKGIGKATLAYRLTRHILSQGAQVPKADDSFSLFGDAPAPATAPSTSLSPEDPLFRRIAAGSHSDLLVLSPSFDSKKGTERAEITADEARAVPGFLSLTPAEGDWRVVIVDAVDQLNTHAANALLKILEEPPERAILFLVCHEPGGILPTIRSRCRHFHLTAPGMEAFEQTLSNVAPDIDRTDYASLYALAYGSPGLAVTLAAHDALAHYGHWTAAMRPGAEEAKTKLLATASNLRQPEAWSMFIHCWRTALHRLSIYPQIGEPVSAREQGDLAAIAAHVPLQLRLRWYEQGRQLMHMTDTFNLDKRNTVRLMLDPVRLDSLQAA